MSVGGNWAMRWSQYPMLSSWMQSFPEKAAIGNDDSMTVPVKFVECEIW